MLGINQISRLDMQFDVTCVAVLELYHKFYAMVEIFIASSFLLPEVFERPLKHVLGSSKIVDSIGCAQ